MQIWICEYKTTEGRVQNKKMTGGTPEVRSDKSQTLLTFDILFLTFDIWHLTYYIWHITFDIWHSTNGPMDQWTFDIWHFLVTSIALLLFKRLRITPVTPIASMDWMKIWKMGWIYRHIYNGTSSLLEPLSELTVGANKIFWEKKLKNYDIFLGFSYCAIGLQRLKASEGDGEDAWERK